MARTSPGQFVRQVRQEVSKVVWPTARETWVSTLMVFAMVALTAVFFMLVDMAFSQLINLILPGRG